jgi:hypothetical protein
MLVPLVGERGQLAAREVAGRVADRLLLLA